MSYIFVAYINQKEAGMHSSAHTLGSGDCRLARVRETRTSYAGISGMAASVEPSHDSEQVTSERAGLHSSSNRIHLRLGEQVEYALFAVTLAAIGYLEALALLA
jgi:hypothetical protein